MPRGVYNRKKSAAKKKVTKKGAPRRRAKSPVEAIPTIARSAIRSSISQERAPATSTVVAAPEDQLVIEYCVFGNDSGDGGDGDISWGAYGNTYDSFDAAVACAKSNVEDGEGPVYIVQIVGVVERPKDVIVRRAAPSL